MLTMSIALLFSVAAISAVLVLAHSFALALPAWRQTKAALEACPAFREATVRYEYRYERGPLPRGRTATLRPAPVRRRALRAEPLSAAA